MKHLFTFFLILQITCLFPQQEEKKSTLVVKKKTSTLKARYEESASKLIAVDGYGNVFDSSIVSYKVTFTINRETKTVVLMNSKDVFNIRSVDPATEVKFERILFRKENGSLLELPAFTIVSPRISKEARKKG